MTYQVLRDKKGRVAILELYRDPVGRGLASADWGLTLAEAWQAAMEEAGWPPVKIEITP